jgi:hypothetical protein
VGKSKVEIVGPPEILEQIVPVHGNQEGSASNGHFGSICYHPLFCFNNYGDCEGAVLRPGNVHSANGWRQFLSPIVDRYKVIDKKLYLRGDAAFASPDIYEYLEGKGILYAIRLKANNNLYQKIEHLMTRPVGRPSRKPVVLFHSFSYRAASWDMPRRVVARVEWHQGELFPRVGSSSPTCRPHLMPSSISTTSEEHANNTSRGASSPSPGRGCRASATPPTGCVSPCSCWRTTWGTS